LICFADPTTRSLSMTSSSIPNNAETDLRHTQFAFDLAKYDQDQRDTILPAQADTAREAAA